MKKTSKSANKNMGIMAFVKFLAFILPLAVYLLLILFVFPAPNSGFIALGILGSIIIGLGCVNIAGIIDDMYWGHIITVVLIILGSLLIVVSSTIMYTPEIYSRLNESHISFYFIGWTILVISGIYYPFFRHAISLDLRSNGMSKSNIKEKMEGTHNYWWYQRVKDHFSHKWVFWANKLFTIIFPCVCLTQLILGWWSTLFIFTLIALLALLTLNFAMAFLIVETWNQAHSDRSGRASLIILGTFVFPITAAVGLIMYFTKFI